MIEVDKVNVKLQGDVSALMSEMAMLIKDMAKEYKLKKTDFFYIVELAFIKEDELNKMISKTFLNRFLKEENDNE